MTHNELLKKDATTLHFWRDKITWRSAGTGMNKNVIGTYNPYFSKDDIISYIKENTVPYGTSIRYLDKSLSYGKYFIDVVNDCMEKVWSKNRGYVFSTDQLKEVIKLCPDVRVSWDSTYECYWCSKTY